MRRLFVPIALTFAVAVGACGDDSSSSTAATTAAASTTAGASSSAVASTTSTTVVTTTAAATTAAATTATPATTAAPAAAATQPPATQPPATQPPATQPPATQPPATQPPATQPPATQPPATQPSGGGSAALSIQSFAFSPNPITVKAGTTITVTNKDGAPHTFTADGGAWTSPSLGLNGTYSRVFNDVGTFAFHCDVHPTMKGTVVVN